MVICFLASFILHLFRKKKREKEKKRERETVGEEINLPQSLVIYQTTSLGF